MKPNAETVKKIREFEKYILEEPRRFNLAFWGYHFDPKNPHGIDRLAEELMDDFDYDEVENVVENKPPCGTVGCAAGNICIQAGLIRPEMWEGLEIFRFPHNTDVIASNYLGISREDAEKLFFLSDWIGRDGSGKKSGWPSQFADRLYQEIPGTKEYTQVCVDRFEHYIETGD